MKKSLREDKEGEEKILMRMNVKLREIERETKHLFTTVSFQVSFMFSFLNNKPICLAASYIL